MISIEESFNSEAKKLESAINSSLEKPKLTIPEIIQVYYQTMTVVSLADVLKQQLSGLDEHISMIGKVDDVLKFISEKFDSELHPLIMALLENTIASITKNLQFENTLKKSKDQLEEEEKLYDQLRQTISTKEFVEQYHKGLSYD